jgi:hypothetical protein
MRKRQLLSPGFVKDFISKIHTVGEAFDNLSLDQEGQLEAILSDPTLNPNEMPDMEKFPTTIRTFILEYITFLQVLGDPSVPIEDKYGILSLLVEQDNAENYKKRRMRFGLRKRQDAAPFPDEGPKLDDAEKLGKDKLNSILGPQGTLDPLGQMTDSYGAEAADVQDYTTWNSEKGGYALEPVAQSETQDAAEIPSPSYAKDAGPPEIDDATIDPPEDASRDDWFAFVATSVDDVATPVDVQGGVVKYPWDPNNGETKDSAKYLWETAEEINTHADDYA